MHTEKITRQQNSVNKTVLQKSMLITFSLTAVLAGTVPVQAKDVSSSDELTRRAVQLFEQKNAQQAIDLERQAVKKKNSDWLPHALLSYFLWRDSKPWDAIAEGKTATKLAPRLPMLLINLGIMEQLSGDSTSAIGSFAEARRLAPTDWRASLGQAQSLLLADRKQEALGVLGQMSAQISKDFNWYYEVGQAYLAVDEPGRAVDVAPKAMALAANEEQRSKSLCQLFLAYIKDNQIDKAKELSHKVFNDAKPTDAQMYVRAASSLVSPLTPESAQVILSAATANLSKPDDSETFFHLARTFDEKAQLVSYDATKYSAWLNNEESAYRQAIKLSSGSAAYHVGLASILAQQGKAKEMTQELESAWAIDNRDQLVGYLLSRVKPLDAAGKEAVPAIDSVTVASHLHLIEATIGVSGLSCSCKLNIVGNSFRGIRGIVLTTVSAKFPYKARVLIDQSMLPISEAMLAINARKPFTELNYELISTNPIETAGQALSLDARGYNLANQSFTTDFSQLQATLPDRSVAANN